MNAKETDQWACNINAVGCTMLRKNLLHDAMALPYTRPRADKVQRRGHMVGMGGKEWAHGGQRTDAWWTHTRQTQEAYKICRQTQGEGLEAWPKRTRGGRKAGTWQTKCGDADKAESRRTMADTWRTSSGNAARAYCGQPFFF